MSIYLGETPLANTGYDKANTSLSNLSSTGKNIANWSSNVTNCITNIPQDIKLELNNGTLTLKAGSKVYNSNGLITTTDVDILDPTASVNDTVFLIYIPSTNSLGTAYMTGESVSSLPTPTTSYKLYYNTTDRKCYIDNGTWLETSFPLAITTSTTTQFVSIDQVFNGFGYVGSTVFALPGVKGLIPNGRNTDGTLKNIEFTTSRVLTVNVSGSVNNYSIVLNDSGLYALGVYQEVDKPVRGYVNYIESENYIYNGLNQRSWTFVGSYNTSSGKITSFNPKTPFHALDYNDSSTISGWAMPSSRYINLTLGATGSTYTAPANGWFYISKLSGANSQYLTIGGNGVYTRANVATSGHNAVEYVPCIKGASISVNYNLSGATNAFRFIYAEGENNV